VGLVYQRVADSPGMGKVPLLVAQVVVVSETRSVGAGSLEAIVGIKFAVVVEVVIGSEALMVIDLVIEADGKLIGIDGADGDDLILTGPDIGGGNVLLQQVGGDGILAGPWGLCWLGRPKTNP
jgi:hypothetical protein